MSRYTKADMVPALLEPSIHGTLSLTLVFLENADTFVKIPFKPYLTLLLKLLLGSTVLCMAPVWQLSHHIRPICLQNCHSTSP
jgi:hypothetical protein